VIYWNKKYLVFPSGYECSASVRLVRGKWLVANCLPKEEGLNTPVLEEYREYEFLFKKESADKLPDHQPWDLAIQLVEGIQLPHGPIYALPEHKAELLQ
jgi:hypothetical protein